MRLLKVAAITLAVLFGSCESGGIAIADAQLDRDEYMPELMLVDFYKRNYPTIDTKFISKVALDVRQWSLELCIDQEADTILCMIHCESRFNPLAIDPDRKGSGLGQTRYKERKRWKKFWESRGYALESFDDPTTQVAYCVAEFYTKLQASKGKVWDAVRRYNGSGANARRHAHKVANARARIYGRPAHSSEDIRDSGGCP